VIDPIPANNKAIKQAPVDNVKPIKRTDWIAFDTVVKFKCNIR